MSNNLGHEQLEVGGGSGIRTHGEFPHTCFQDRRHSPLGHPSALRPKSSPAGLPRRASYTIVSAPMYGRSAAGVSIDPSSRWYVSSTAMITRGSASPEPFSVCGYCGRAPASGR